MNYKVKTKDDGTKTVGDGVGFERIRRITGYLVGDSKTRFNNAKKAEERDRVKHTLIIRKNRCEKS